ncbi:MAG: SH3 domain-containing protein [Oscillospiraceae bacterium]|jgi:uncharacterized protein YgiM (DUF1202 family)|nr:SH3 domain-containing protein [Oscillospiraceae bacterium]
MKLQTKKLKALLVLLLVLACVVTPLKTDTAHAAPKVGATLYVSTPSKCVLRMRSGPNVNSSVIAKLPNGQAVTYVSRSGNWYKVRAAGYTGYMYNSYLSTSKGSGSGGSSGGGGVSLGNHLVSHKYGSNINIRQKAGLDERILASVPSGSIVIVMDSTKYWSLVEWYGYIGWMSNDFIK